MHSAKHHSAHAGKRARKSKPKRKMNEFMKKAAAARKSNAKSFVYKGVTYKRHTKGPLVYYKKA